MKAREVAMVTARRVLKLGATLAAAIVVLSSCVSAGFVNFDTAEALAPGHIGIQTGAEGPGVTHLPDAFASLRVGLPLGAQLGVRGGLGTLLADLKYKLPFAWRRLALAVGLSGGANFNHQVAQASVPLFFSYRFSKAFAVTASQTTTLYLGKYSGFAASVGGGVKWNIGRFYVFPKLVVGYFAPSGGTWTAYGGNIGRLGSYNITIGQQQFFSSIGVALGFDF